MTEKTNKDYLKDLKELTEKLEKQQATLRIKKEDFAKQVEDDTILIKDTESKIKEIKTCLSEKAVEHFEETKEKSFIGGIKVQEIKSLEYDEKKAFEFCLDKKILMTLDKKAFEKTYSSLGVDFVKEVKGLRVTFPKVIKLEE